MAVSEDGWKLRTEARDGGEAEKVLELGNFPVAYV